MNIIQIIIFITSATAIWLVSRKEHWKRWGYIIGFIGQPFWFYDTITKNQWGIFLLTVFFAYSYGQGIYNYWVKK